MVATAALANVVIQGRHEQQYWIAKSVRDSRRYRKLVRVVCPQKSTAVGDDLHGVCVNRIGVEHVKLHLPHNHFKLRKITAQYTMA